MSIKLWLLVLASGFFVSCTAHSSSDQIQLSESLKPAVQEQRQPTSEGIGRQQNIPATQAGEEVSVLRSGPEDSPSSHLSTRQQAAFIVLLMHAVAAQQSR